MAELELYASGIRRAYEGEIGAEQVYASLAARAKDAAVRARFAAISAVEGATHRVLGPVAARLGISIAADEVKATVTRRTAELSQLTWPEFIARARRDWPAYIDRFKALRNLAPPTDREALDHLVEHEIALVEFILAECSGAQGERSIEILYRYVRSLADEAPL